MNGIIRVLNCSLGTFSEKHSKNYYDFRKFLDQHFIPNANNSDRFEEPFYTCPTDVLGYTEGKMTVFFYHTGDSDVRIGEPLLMDIPPGITSEHSR